MTKWMAIIKKYTSWINTEKIIKLIRLARGIKLAVKMTATAVNTKTHCFGLTISQPILDMDILLKLSKVHFLTGRWIA